MENTLNRFKQQQSETLNLLNQLQQFLRNGSDVGVGIEPALMTKVQQAAESVGSEKLKVALVGGFSEGKTSIAAAWMEKLDKSTMKISQQESSNEVTVYEVGEEFALVDTPGLFGFKEQENAETHAIEKYKDITKKHVSDAHLVLYVMNSTNPIKESHEEELIWLFNTLGVLPRTVFVLSQFDQVADVEDEEDYQDNLAIKRQNVSERLQETLSLADDDVAALSIVAVAANPFDLGVEHWLQHKEQFKALSHIESLQQATSAKIQQSGGREELALEMQNSVIRDVMHKHLPQAIDADEVISAEVEKLGLLHGRLSSQMAQTERDIEQTRIRLRDFIVSYFTDLIMQARGCSMETIGEFVEREIGDEGIIIQTTLENEFSRQMGAINLQLEKMQSSYNSEVSHFNTTVRSLSKAGIEHTLQSNLINNQTILVARDGIVNVAKTFGVDIAEYLKFKPWGAEKLANGVSGALAFVGVAMELWDSYDQYKREEQFQKSVKETVEGFEKQRRDLLELVNSEDFRENFFGNYVVLKKQLQELDQKLTESSERQQRFRAWRAEAEAIAGQTT